MPHTRTKFLAAAHDLLSTYLTPDSVLAFDHLLDRATTNPRQLKPPEGLTPQLPARAGPPLTLRHPRRARAPVAYFRVNTRLECIDVSPALVQLCEVDHADDLLGSHWEQYVDADDLRGLWEQWMVAAQTHQGFAFTYSFHTPTGRALTLHQWVKPLRDDRTLALKGWFGCVHVVAKVIRIEAPTRVEAIAIEPDEISA